MPSAADIPAELLYADKREQFVTWLTSLPLDWPTTRSIAHIWTNYTKQQLRRDDWLYLETTTKSKTNV